MSLTISKNNIYRNLLLLLIFCIQCSFLLPSSWAVAAKGVLSVLILTVTFTKRKQIINAKLIGVLGAIIIFVLLSTVGANDTAYAGSYMNKFILAYLNVIAISQCISSEEDVEFALEAFYYSGLIYLIFIFVFQGPADLFLHGVNRRYTGGIIMNYTYVSIPVSIIAGYKLLSSEFRKTITVPVWIFVYMMNVFSERRKSALIPFLALVVIYIVQNYKQWKMSTIVKLIVLSSLGIFFLVYSTQNQFLYNHFGYRILDLWNSITAIEDLQVDASTKSLMSRSESVGIGMDYFWENPLKILGIGNYSTIVAGTASMPHAHNNYIEMLTTVGVWTALVFYSLYAKIIFTGKKFLDNPYMILIISISILFLIMDYATTTYWEATSVSYIVLGYLYVKYVNYKSLNE